MDKIIRDRFISDLPLPGRSHGPTAFARAVEEAQLLGELRDTPAFKGMQALWHTQAMLVRRGLHGQQDRFERAREELAALDLPEQIVRDAEMAAAQPESEPVELRVQAMTADPARDAVNAAEELAATLAQPGMRMLFQRLQARMWAHYDMLRTCDPKDQPRHAAFLRGAYRPFAVLQGVLDRGTVAATLIARRQAQEK